MMAVYRNTGRSQNNSKTIVGKHVIHVDDLEVLVISKKRLRTAHLRIQPDRSIELTAPPHFSDEFLADFVRQKRDWIKRAQERMAKSPMGRAATATPEELEECRSSVEACAPILIAQWSVLLAVRPTKVVFRKMKSRWGSCQPSTGRICLNILLGFYPAECLEYVIVHELCHLLVPGHGENFKAIMDLVMPDWKKRRALLR